MIFWLVIFWSNESVIVQVKMPKCEFTIYVKGGVPQYLIVNSDKKQTQHLFSEGEALYDQDLIEKLDISEDELSKYDKMLTRTEYLACVKYQGGTLDVFYNFYGTRGKVCCQYCRGGRSEEGYYPNKSMTIVKLDTPKVKKDTNTNTE